MATQSEEYDELAVQAASDWTDALSGATHTTRSSISVTLKPLDAGILGYWYHHFTITVPNKTKVWVCTAITGGRTTGHILYSCKDQNDNTLAGPFLQYTYEDGFVFSMTVPAGTSTITAYYEDDNEYSTTSATLKMGYSIGQHYGIGNARISSIGEQVYTGRALTPKPKVEMQSTTLVDADTYSTEWLTLKEGVDYRLSYSNNIKSGTATVTITGIGQYEGTVNRPFSIRRFKDVPTSHWANAVIARAADLGLVSGYSDGRFGPNDLITRGQAAVVLWNMAGRPQGNRGFKDLDPKAYYYNAVRWASSAGVVSGYKDGRFGPNDNVTREQLAAMLANYARQVAHKSVEGSKSDFASMRDKDKVSGWAVPSVGWCFRNGILSGAGGNVNPHGNAARAEAAKMMVVFHDMLS